MSATQRTHRNQLPKKYDETKKTSLLIVKFKKILYLFLIFFINIKFIILDKKKHYFTTRNNKTREGN